MTTKEKTVTLGDRYYKYKTLYDLRQKGLSYVEIAKTLNIVPYKVRLEDYSLSWRLERDPNMLERWGKMEWAFDLTWTTVRIIEEFSYQSINNKPLGRRAP